jgi:hypothetical protein
MEEGLWQAKKQWKVYRSRKERRAGFGELLQFDGSRHRWFEGRRPSCCLSTLEFPAYGDHRGSISRLSRLVSTGHTPLIPALPVNAVKCKIAERFLLWLDKLPK